VHGPLRVRAQARLETWIIGKGCVIDGVDETTDEAFSQFSVRALAGMDTEVLQALLVVRSREGEKGSLATGELIDGRARHRYREPCSACASSAARRAISSSETSSKCVAKYHLLPNAS